MIMVDKFNHVFYESTIFLRISFISSSMTLAIFLIGLFTPSWKYIEFTLDFNGLSANEKINHLDEEVKMEDSNASNVIYLYDSMQQERNLSSLDLNDLYALLTKKSVNQSLLRSLVDEPPPLYTAQVKVGLWKTEVCTQVQAEERCLEPFGTQGYTWIRRSRGFCILALGMSLLTVILILMCLFLSIAADMLLTHVMTLLTSVISVSSIVVGILIFTTNHMKLDEITMVSNNFGKLQVPVSKISWACWLSASAAPTAAMTVLFLGLNIVFF